MGLRQWLGLQSVVRTVTDHEARIVTPDPDHNPMQRFKASLPEGALDAPVREWPRAQLAGYLVATCEHSRSAFFNDEDWAIRSASALANLLFDTNLPRLAVTYNLEGTREGVAREVGTFLMTAHNRADLPAFTDQPDRPDQATAVAADPEAPMPSAHLAPLWADQAGVLAVYDEVATALTDRPGADLEASAHRAINATVYVLNVVEYLSRQNLAVYDQTMKGLSKASDTDRDTITRRRSMAYALASTRTEIALPAPTVAPDAPAGRRPM